MNAGGPGEAPVSDGRPASSPADADRRLPFGDDVVEAVLRHMRDDHSADGVQILRRNGVPEAAEAIMTGFDALDTFWQVTDVGGSERAVVIPWPSRVTDRPSVRRLVVELFEA